MFSFRRPSRISPFALAVVGAFTASSLAQGNRSAPPVPYAAPALPPVPTTVDHLHGVVVSSVTGKPVARVLVTTPGGDGLAVLTDFEGRFPFDLRRALPQESTASTESATARTALQFNLRKPEYVGGPQSATVPTYTPSEPEPDIVLQITPAAVITGHIAIDSGDLPPSLRVQIRRKRIDDGQATFIPGAIAKPDPSGDFRFADLPPGEYNLFTAAAVEEPPTLARDGSPESARGILPGFAPETTSLEAAPFLHLGAGEAAMAGINLHSATFYPVTVPLASSDAAALSVTFPDSPGYELQYDRRDAAVKGLLPSGTYTLRIVAMGNPQAPARGERSAASNDRRAAVVPLHVPAHALRTEPVPLRSIADIPIVVHGDLPAPPQNSSAPAQPVTLTLLPTDTSGFGGANASELASSGELRLHSVLEGVYHVRASPSAPSSYVASLTSGTTDLLREPLVVGTGGAAAPIEVTLRNDPATLNVDLVENSSSGASSADRSAPSRFAAIFAFALDTPERQAFTFTRVLDPPASPSSSSPQSGTLSGLPPGKYLVIAAQSASLPTPEFEYRNRAVLETLLSQGTVVTLAPNQTSEVRVPLLPSPENK